MKGLFLTTYDVTAEGCALEWQLEDFSPEPHPIANRTAGIVRLAPAGTRVFAACMTNFLDLVSAFGGAGEEVWDIDLQKM